MSNKLLSLAVVAPIAISLLAVSAPANAAPSNDSVPEKFTFNGAGWGHGVGMSQYGAYGMALDGYNAEQILEHYYNPAQLTKYTANASKDILVQVLTGVNKSTITPKNGQLRVKVGGKTYNSSNPVVFEANSDKVSVTVNGKKYTANGADGVTLEWQNTRYWNSGNADTTVTVPQANGGYGTGEYRHGKITVKLLKNKLNIVNSLRLNDEYLYGLAEVPSSWPEETLKAQAIAGRTYAMRNMNSVKSACGCNVYDEVASQKFTGWIKENEANGVIGKKWVNAVNKTQIKSNGVPTSAQVVTYNESLIDAVYSSSTGGKTKSAKSVWGSEHAYLQSRDDHWALDARTGNPNRLWKGTASQEKVAKAYGLDNVKSISVKKNADDTIYSSTAVSTSGKKSTLNASQTRSLFGAKSTWVFGITADGEKLPATDDYTVTKVQSGVKYKPTSNLNMRRGPSTGYSVVKTLAKGVEVSTTGRKSGSWLEVKSGTQEGWVSESYLEKVSTPTKPVPKPTPPVTKPPVEVSKTVNYSTTANVHMRQGAGTNHKSLGVLNKGVKVTGTGKTSGKWIQVKSGSKTGWVSGTYLKKNSSTASNNKPTQPKPPVTASKSVTYSTTANVHLRQGAGTTQKSLGVMKKGATVTGTGKKSGSWTQVKYGSKTGWVSSSYIKKKSTTSSNASVSSKSKTTKANLNMRSGAGTGHKIMLTIPNNKKVTLTGKKSGNWTQVKYGSKTGWVSASYLK